MEQLQDQTTNALGADAYMAAPDAVNENLDPEVLLEELGETLVFADIRDLTGLAGLHTSFEQFAGLVGTSKDIPELTWVPKLAGQAISQIILEECADPQFNLCALGEMVDYLRSTLRSGKPSGVPETWRAFESPDDGPIRKATDTIDTERDLGSSFMADPELLQEFFQEAREHLEQAEVHLLDLEANPEDSEAISAVFRAFHTVKGAAGFLQLPSIQSLSHVAESLLDRIRQGAIRMEGEVIDLSLEATDGLKKLVEEVEGGGTAADPSANWLDSLVTRIEAATQGQSPARRVGDILVERGSASREAVDVAVAEQATMDPKPKLASLLISKGEIRAEDAVDALRAQRDQRRPATVQRESIKVDADRLDQLVDLIGELVIAESMVRQADELQADPMSPLNRRVGQMGKITRELQAISMSLRMVPVRATFQKMARLVRDLAKKFGKEVEFVTEGEDTELDKNVVDLVADPLMHMVRNAIDHGVETPDEREAAGKPRKARVVLRAYHEGGGIYIDIVDDGHGLDRDAILNKAMDRGLVQPGETLADAEVWKLIFHPGLSTAKKVTDVSGRGVGMDVVQRNIHALHGNIEIQSRPGMGSTFSIRLPLTLAIIDGMAIRAGDERFIVPIGNVIRATRPKPNEVHTIRGDGEVLRQHDRLITLFRLHQIMNVQNAIEEPEKGIVLILEDNGRQIGLLADELIGQQQIVIKPLGKAVGHVRGIAGGAIMPDGRVGLILDTGGLFKRAREGEPGPVLECAKAL